MESASLPPAAPATASPSGSSTAGPLDTHDILALARAGALPATAIEPALRLLGLTPDRDDWRQSATRLAPAIAVLAVIGGVICLVAANWQELGRLAKFGAALFILAALAIAAIVVGPARPLGQALLTVAIGLIGPALALYGQTYQTGADVHGLMFTWAVLALPWMVAARSAMAWLLVLAILQGGGVLWLMSRQAWPAIPGPWPLPTWLVAAALQAMLLVAWEIAATRLAWLSSRWPQRVLATCLLGVLSAAAIATLVNSKAFGLTPLLAPLVWLGSAVAIAAWYGQRRPDPAILAALLLSATAVAGTAVAMATHSVFLTGLAVLAVAAAGSAWLRNRQLREAR